MFHLAVLVVLAMLISACAAREEPPAEIAATELWKAYDSAPSAADRRFKGRRFLVTGQVLWRSVERPILKFDVGAKAPAGVQATLLVAAVETPAAGQSISLRCTCRGIFAMVLLEDCVAESRAR